MKIIIGGAGAVGKHLAQLFSREHHDITILDENPAKYENLIANYDLMGRAVSPTSIEGLKSVGVKDADLVIGVTPDETANLTCCMLASKMGAKNTVARVSTLEYIQPANREFFKEVGIGTLFIPEMIAAQEIASSVQRSWIRQLWEVENGALVLMGIKVRQNCKILNVPLKELGGPDVPYHIVAIKRKDETLIPHGDDSIQAYDLVYFMTTRKYIPYIRELAGKENYPDVKNVIIMGGGRTAVYATRLMPSYMHVKIIEKDRQRCNQLNELIENNNVMVIHGDGRDVSLLSEENIENAEAFIGLTSSTEANILGCLTAKRMNVSKTIAMLDNLSFVNMAESLDLGTLINKQAIAASYIYQMMLKADVTNVKSLMVANADVAEFNVKPGSKITKKKVKDLHLPLGCTLGGLVRNNQGILISGNTVIEPGDLVVAFCLASDLNRLSSYFA